MIWKYSQNSSSFIYSKIISQMERRRPSSRPRNESRAIYFLTFHWLFLVSAIRTTFTTIFLFSFSTISGCQLETVKAFSCMFEEPLSLSHTHTHTHCLSLTHTHTHTKQKFHCHSPNSLAQIHCSSFSPYLFCSPFKL